MVLPRDNSRQQFQFDSAGLSLTGYFKPATSLTRILTVILTMPVSRTSSSASFVSAGSSRTFFGCERHRGGVMLFTGPDAIRDHRVSVEPEQRYVGEGTMSPEGTSEVAYLWRAPSHQAHPRPKSRCVGEIGWGVPHLADWSTAQTGVQIKLGEFRQAVEDRTTHLYQNAWYPGPHRDTNMSNNLVLGYSPVSHQGYRGHNQTLSGGPGSGGQVGRLTSDIGRRPVSSSYTNAYSRHAAGVEY